MTSKIVTHNNGLHAARAFIESISEQTNTAYYVFMGAHVAAANTETVLEDTVQTIHRDAYRNMIQGKRVGSDDALLMIRNVPWVSNKVFAMFDDTDADLLASDYYCVVNASSFYHIYKCLDNNRGANSTAQPNFAHVSGANTQVYQTSDGYRWKYMYSVSNFIKSKFATTDYFPVAANTTVEDNAVDGAIEIVKVDGTGRGYDNYLLGTFGASDLRINGNTALYRVSNTTASSVNGFYTGCLAYISTGTGTGSYSTIEDYFVTEDGNFIVLEDAFEIAPLNGSEYQIYPGVTITGSGAETLNAVCRALVNSTGSNSIYRVEAIDRGAGYDYAVAVPVSNTVVGVPSVAELRPILSPFGGHGKDAGAELGATRLCVSAFFANSESNTLLTSNSFRQIGLLMDPLFANVEMDFTSVSGTYLVGEPVCKINPVRISTLATINTTSAILTSGDSANLMTQVAAGDYLYLVSDAPAYQYVEVESVSNSTQIILGSTGLFSCTTTSVYQANASSNGYVLAVNSALVAHFSNVSGVFSNGDLVIGHNSGTLGTVNTVSRNGVLKGFENYIELYKYTATPIAGTFSEDETVYQANLTTANASLHSALVDGSVVTLYTSNQVGAFDVGGTNTVVGNTSAASALLTGKFSPELVFGSGKVLYLEDVDSIDRAVNQTETIKIIFEF